MVNVLANGKTQKVNIYYNIDNPNEQYSQAQGEKGYTRVPNPVNINVPANTNRGGGGRTPQLPQSTPDNITPTATAQPLPTRSELSEGINPKTRLPYGTVTKAPNAYEQLKESIKDRGLVKGSIDYLGNKAVRGFERTNTYLARKGDRYAYKGEAEASTAIKGGVTTAIYSTPLATPLLILGGAESAFKGKTVREKAAGVVEATIGGLILKKDISAYKAFRTGQLQEQAITKTVGVRVEAPKGKGGVDIYFQQRTTNPTITDDVLGIKSSTEIIKVKQPYYNVGSNKVSLEGGKGISVNINKAGEVKATSFEVSGRGKSLDVNLRAGRNGVSQETPLQASGGYINVKTKTQIEGQLTKKGKDIFLTGKPSRVDTRVRKNFIGGSKEEGDVITFVSAKADKARLENKIITIKAKPEGYGVVKRFSPREDTNILSGGGRTLTKRKPKQIVNYASDVFQATQTATKAPSIQIPRTPKTTQAIIGKTTQDTKTNIITLQAEKTKLKEDTLQNSALNLGMGSKIIQDQTPKTSGKFGDVPIITFGTPQTTREKDRIIEGVIQKTPSIEKTEQRTRARLTPALVSRMGDFLQSKKANTPPIKPKTFLSSSKNKMSQSVRNIFEAFVRRRGKDISQGVFGSQRDAERKLREVLGGTLGASGFLTKNNRKVRARDTSLFNGEFRPGKKDIFRIVQKERYRLKKGDSQVREINLFRKKKQSIKKSKSKKNFWFD